MSTGLKSTTASLPRTFPAPCSGKVRVFKRALNYCFDWCRVEDLNPWPTVYKEVSARCFHLTIWPYVAPVSHSDDRWAWPRDGKRETLEGAGIALAEQYREQGLNMLREHAQFEDGSVSVEAGLMAMLDRMRTGKLKVFKEHLDWWEEFRLYHRKDGKVVKEGDDLMCATRYALMMLRFATTKSFNDKWRRPIEYSNLGIA